jgi:hypothetical protein
MTRFFNDDRSQPSRALQAWYVLVGAAFNRQTLTYTMLSEIVGFGGAGVWAEILGHVMWYCRQNDLPLLTALVVNQETGLPGGGIDLSPEACSVERERVYRMRAEWYRIRPPSEEELADAWRRRS